MKRTEHKRTRISRFREGFRVFIDLKRSTWNRIVLSNTCSRLYARMRPSTRYPGPLNVDVSRYCVNTTVAERNDSRQIPGVIKKKKNI